jgi:hypothetical protein
MIEKRGYVTLRWPVILNLFVDVFWTVAAAFPADAASGLNPTLAALV